MKAAEMIEFPDCITVGVESERKLSLKSSLKQHYFSGIILSALLYIRGNCIYKIKQEMKSKMTSLPNLSNIHIPWLPLSLLPVITLKSVPGR